MWGVQVRVGLNLEYGLIGETRFIEESRVGTGSVQPIYDSAQGLGQSRTVVTKRLVRDWGLA